MRKRKNGGLPEKKLLKKLNSKPVLKKLLLIGEKLEHSFSPLYFKQKFSAENHVNWSYAARELSDIAAVGKLRKEENLVGFNVTIPYKSAIIPYLDELDSEAEAIGAVNTVVLIPQKGEVKLKGYNTDKPAFGKTLIPYLPQIKGAMILGDGGAARAVRKALQGLGIKTITISRKGPYKFTDIKDSALQEYNLIINCTPLGMFPHIKTCPKIPYELLDSSMLLYDLVYNPRETLFLSRGLEKGCICINGQTMLELQAELAFDLWLKNEELNFGT